MFVLGMYKWLSSCIVGLVVVDASVSSLDAASKNIAGDRWEYSGRAEKEGAWAFNSLLEASMVHTKLNDADKAKVRKNRVSTFYSYVDPNFRKQNHIHLKAHLQAHREKVMHPWKVWLVDQYLEGTDTEVEQNALFDFLYAEFKDQIFIAYEKSLNTAAAEFLKVATKNAGTFLSPADVEGAIGMKAPQFFSSPLSKWTLVSLESGKVQGFRKSLYLVSPESYFGTRWVVMHDGSVQPMDEASFKLLTGDGSEVEKLRRSWPNNVVASYHAVLDSPFSLRLRLSNTDRVMLALEFARNLNAQLKGELPEPATKDMEAVSKQVKKQLELFQRSRFCKDPKVEAIIEGAAKRLEASNSASLASNVTVAKNAVRYFVSQALADGKLAGEVGSYQFDERVERAGQTLNYLVENTRNASKPGDGVEAAKKLLNKLHKAGEIAPLRANFYIMKKLGQYDPAAFRVVVNQLPKKQYNAELKDALSEWYTRKKATEQANKAMFRLLEGIVADSK